VGGNTVNYGEKMISDDVDGSVYEDAGYN